MNKSDKTRQYIIEKTAPVFNKKGYAGASMSELIKAIGLSKGAIYGNFKNKDEIALEAFNYNIRRSTKKLYSLISQKNTAIEKLQVFPKFFNRTYQEIFSYGGCPILNTAVDSDDTHPELKKRVNTTIFNWNMLIINIINEGIENNEIDKSIKAEEYSSIFISLIEGGIMLSKTTENGNYLLNSLKHIEFLINSFIKK